MIPAGDAGRALGRASPSTSCDDARDVPSRPGFARRLRGRCGAHRAGGCRARGRPRARAPGATDARQPAPRLDVPAAADPGNPRGAPVVGVGRGPRQRRAPAEPRAPPPDGCLRGRHDGPGVRPAVRDRALRHDAVLRPHGPAPAADHGRRAADRPCRADHADPAAQFPGDAAAASCCRSSTRG